MEISRPVKNALSLGRFTFDIKTDIKNRINISSSNTTTNLNTNQKRRNSKDATKNEKFSSKLSFTQHPIPNCIQDLKNSIKKQSDRCDVRSQLGTVQYKDDSTSHMPVYHKVTVV